MDRRSGPTPANYDCDAPIAEAGWLGDKFAACRAAITPFLAPGGVVIKVADCCGAVDVAAPLEE